MANGTIRAVAGWRIRFIGQATDGDSSTGRTELYPPRRELPRRPSNYFDATTANFCEMKGRGKPHPRRSNLPMIESRPDYRGDLTALSENAVATACVRLATPSLRKMRCRWLLTVNSLIWRTKPIS